MTPYWLGSIQGAGAFAISAFLLGLAYGLGRQSRDD